VGQSGRGHYRQQLCQSRHIRARTGNNGRRHGVFFGTSLLLGFPGAVEAKGEAEGAAFFLFAFGFFFSRLLLIWPFATVSS
jgi:hypothetical protein